MVKKEQKLIWEITRNCARRWFGSRYKVYRQCDVEFILKMHRDYAYLGELWTRCKLVYNDDKFRNQCIKKFNKQVDVFKAAYPENYQFQAYKHLPLIKPLTP